MWIIKTEKHYDHCCQQNKTMLLHNNVKIILFNSILLSNESENLSRIIIHTYMLYLMWIINTLSCSLVSRKTTITDCVMFTVLLVTVPCSSKIINKAADKLLKLKLDKSRILFFSLYIKTKQSCWINLAINRRVSAAASSGFKFTNLQLLHALRSYIYFDLAKEERRTQSSSRSIFSILLCEYTTRLIETTKCQCLAVKFTEYE